MLRWKRSHNSPTTADVSLVSPLIRLSGVGVVDLLTKMLSFRLEPKVVGTLEGQGGAADPLGFTVPVIIRGPWNEPEIYPDVAGIRENPQAAFEKLRALGAGIAGAITGSDPQGDQKSGGNDIVKSLSDFFGGKSDTQKNTDPGKQPPDSPNDSGGASGILRGLFGK